MWNVAYIKMVLKHLAHIIVDLVPRFLAENVVYTSQNAKYTPSSLIAVQQVLNYKDMNFLIF
jgi:hypothetical protein